MKRGLRVISLILICTILLSGCKKNVDVENESIPLSESSTAPESILESSSNMDESESATENETELVNETEAEEVKATIVRLSIEKEQIKNSGEDELRYISSDGNIIIEELDDESVSIIWNGIECVTQNCNINTETKTISLYEPMDYDNDGEMERLFTCLIGARGNPFTYVMDITNGELNIIPMPDTYYDISVTLKDNYTYELYIEGNMTPWLMDNNEVKLDRGHELWDEDGTVIDNQAEIPIWASEWGEPVLCESYGRIIFRIPVYLCAYSGANSFLNICSYYELYNGEWRLLCRTQAGDVPEALLLESSVYTEQELMLKLIENDYTYDKDLFTTRYIFSAENPEGDEYKGVLYGLYGDVWKRISVIEKS